MAISVRCSLGSVDERSRAMRGEMDGRCRRETQNIPAVIVRLGADCL